RQDREARQNLRVLHTTSVLLKAYFLQRPEPVRYSFLHQVVQPEVTLSARLAALAPVHRLVVRTAARLGAGAPVGPGIDRAVEARDDLRLLAVGIGDV